MTTIRWQTGTDEDNMRGRAQLRDRPIFGQRLVTHTTSSIGLCEGKDAPPTGDRKYADVHKSYNYLSSVVFRSATLLLWNSEKRQLSKI